MKKSELTTTQIRLFKEVCKVLIPEYRKLKLYGDYVHFSGRVTTKQGLSDSGLTSIMTLNSLFETILPKRLCIFKYNNEDFMHEVLRDLTSLKKSKKDIYEYYFNELVNLKFPELKDSVETKEEKPTPIQEDAYELFGEEVIILKIRRRPKNFITYLWYNWYFETLVVVLTLLIFTLVLVTK